MGPSLRCPKASQVVCLLENPGLNPELGAWQLAHQQSDRRGTKSLGMRAKVFIADNEQLLWWAHDKVAHLRGGSLGEMRQSCWETHIVVDAAACARRSYMEISQALGPCGTRNRRRRLQVNMDSYGPPLPHAANLQKMKRSLSAASLPDSTSTGASLWLPIHLAHSATQFFASEAGQTITAWAGEEKTGREDIVAGRVVPR